MKKGQGWARRVTLENLPDFAPWLRQADDKQAELEREKRKQKKAEAAGKPSPFRGVPLALPSRFTPPRKKRRKTAAKTIVGKQSKVKAGQRGEPKWRKTLASADAQAPESGNPKGCMTFAQARKDNVIAVDAATYFREDLFKDFSWNEVPSNKPTWEAMVPFDFTIHGQHFGVHVMRLSHKPSRSHGRGNAPTVLHWKNLPKDARQLIRAKDVLSLFEMVKGKRKKIYIEIA